MDAPGEVPGPAADARGALERLLLGGPRRYTRLQVADLAGMPQERTRFVALCLRSGAAALG